MVLSFELPADFFRGWKETSPGLSPLVSEIAVCVLAYPALLLFLLNKKAQSFKESCKTTFSSFLKQRRRVRKADSVALQLHVGPACLRRSRVTVRLSADTFLKPNHFIRLFQSCTFLCSTFKCKHYNYLHVIGHLFYQSNILILCIVIPLLTVWGHFLFVYQKTASSVVTYWS